jgi:hypothetical protein
LRMSLILLRRIGFLPLSTILAAEAAPSNPPGGAGFNVSRRFGTGAK